MSNSKAQGQARATLPALTGARFIAASAVVVFHYGLESLRAISPALAVPAAVGPAAVSFFYVLSGTVITWGCTNRRGEPARPARSFWSQRAARIAPAYFLALLLSFLPFAGNVLQHHPEGGLLWITAGVAATVLLIQAFFPPLAAGFNTPGWSISCEAFFYVLWPRLVRRVGPRGSGIPWRQILGFWAIGLVPPVLGIAALHFGVLPDGAFPTLTEDASASELLGRLLAYFPPFRLPEFLVGICLGHALRSSPVEERPLAVDTALEAAVLAALLATAWAFGRGALGALCGAPLADRIAIESGAMAPLFALTVWQLATGRGIVQRILSRNWFVVLGESSYALYILQEPVVVWTKAVLKRTAPPLLQHWDYTFWAFALLLVAISVFVYRNIESPLRQRLGAILIPGRQPSGETIGTNVEGSPARHPSRTGS